MKKDHQSNNVTKRMGINHILCDHFHYYILGMLGYRCRTEEEDDDGGPINHMFRFRPKN